MDQEQLQIIINANNEKLKKQFADMTKEIQRQANNIEKSFQRSISRISGLTTQATKLTTSLNGAVQASNKLGNSFNNTNKNLNKTSQAVANIKRDLSGLKGDVNVRVNQTRQQVQGSVGTAPMIAGAMAGAMTSGINNTRLTNVIETLNRNVRGGSSGKQRSNNNNANSSYGSGSRQNARKNIQWTGPLKDMVLEQKKILKSMGVKNPLPQYHDIKSTNLMTGEKTTGIKRRDYRSEHKRERNAMDFQANKLKEYGREYSALMAKVQRDVKLGIGPKPQDMARLKEVETGINIANQAYKNLNRQVSISGRLARPFIELKASLNGCQQPLQAIGTMIKFKVERALVRAKDQARAFSNTLKNGLSSASQKFPRLSSGIKKVGQSIRKTGQSIIKAAGDIKRFGTAIKTNIKATSAYQKYIERARKSTEDLGKSSRNATVGLKGMLKSMLAFASVGAVFNFLKGSIQEASNEIEGDNVFRTAFGGKDTAKVEVEMEKMNELIRNAPMEFGATRAEVKKLASEFMFFTSAMVGSREKGFEMTTELTERVTDFASFYNLSFERASEVFMMGMSGQTRAVRSFGIDISEANIKNYAYANGIAKVGAELTEGEKVMARYKIMMAQTSQAEGDFKETTPTMANQIKILNACLNELKSSLGSAFAPILSTVIPILTDFIQAVSKAIRTVALFINVLFGRKMTISGDSEKIEKEGRGIAEGYSKASESVNSAGNAMDGLRRGARDAKDAVKETAKEFKGLMGFDEINLLPSTEKGGGSGGSGGSGGGDGGDINVPTIDWVTDDKVFEEPPKWMEEMANKIKALSETLFKPIKDAWDKVGPKLLVEINKTKDAVIDTFTRLKDAFASIWNNGGSEIVRKIAEIFINLGVIVVRVFNETIMPLLGKFFDLLNPSKNPVMQDFLDVINALLDGIVNLVEYLAGDGFYWVDTFIKAFLGFKVISWVVGLFATLAGAISSAWGTISGVLGAIGAAVGAVGSTAVAVGAAIVGAIGLVIGAVIKLWNESESFRDVWIEAWNNICNTLSVLYNSYIKPILDLVINILKEVWTGGLKPLWESFVEFVGAIGELLGELLSAFFEVFGPILKILGPIILPVLVALGAGFTAMVTTITGVLNTLLRGITSIIKGIKDIFGGLIDFIVGVFTGRHNCPYAMKVA